MDSKYIGAVVEKKLDVVASYATVSSVTALPVDKQTVYATISTAQTLGMASAGAANDGHTTTVYILPSAAVALAIPTSGNYISMCGSSFTTTANKWVEFNFTSVAGKWHIAKLEQE